MRLLPIVRCRLPRRAGLLLAGVLLTLAAHGQQVLTDPDGESCRVTPECREHRYKFKPDPGQTFVRWQVRGDLTLLLPEEQNPGVACSAGFGKGRLTAHYYTLRWRRDEKCRSECPDTVFHTLDYDLFKSFKSPESLHGPACVQGGQAVTYWVPPMLTDWPHRRAGIGTDGYFWSGFPAGSVLHFSGASSAVTVQLPDLLPGGFAVAMQVGRCNAGNELTQLVAVEQLLAQAISLLMGQPNGTGPYIGAAVTTVPGTTYAFSLPSGWQFAPTSSGTLAGNGAVQTVYFSAGSGAGNVIITATGGCGGAQTVGWSFGP